MQNNSQNDTLEGAKLLSVNESVNYVRVHKCDEKTFCYVVVMFFLFLS